MRSSIPLVLSLCALGLAAPAPVSLASTLELKAIFDRAVGDKCKAPEGSGACRNTGSCKGISYPTGLCPKDPKDVQCCVEIKCKAPHSDSFCRSIKNNGCSGGSFKAGFCPGGTDIQCCVKDALPPPPAQTACKPPYGDSLCRSVSKDGCSGGSFKPGYCPGSSDIQCCVKSASPPSPPVQDPNEWPHCQKTLSCTFGQIASSSMAARLSFVQYMQSNFFGRLNAGDQYRAIQGVITFFDRNNLGPPESWVSYVDAGIVEGIQRGGAIVLGMSSNTGGNPGSEVWATFLRGMRDGKLGSRGDHDSAWSEAEQASTEYGVQKADAKFQRSARERNWFWTTQLFRLMMRHRTTSLIFLPDDFVNWLTDVRLVKPAHCMSETGWFFAGQLDGIPNLGDLREASGIIKKLIECFTKNS